MLRPGTVRSRRPGRHIGSRGRVYTIPDGISTGPAPLFRLDARLLDPSGPFGEIVAHEGREFPGRAGKGVEPDARQTLLDRRIGNDPSQLSIETFDHRLGRVGRCENGIPGNQVERRKSRLRHGWNVGQERASLLGGDRKGPDIFRLRLRRTGGKVEQYYPKPTRHPVLV